MSNLQRKIEKFRSKEGITAPEAGILWALTLFVEKEYSKVIEDFNNYIEYHNKAFGVDMKQILKNDIEEVLNDDNMLGELGGLLETDITDNRSVFLGIPKSAKNYIYEKYSNSKNNSFKDSLFARLFIEELYMDLFKDEPNFKSYLLTNIN